MKYFFFRFLLFLGLVKIKHLIITPTEKVFSPLRKYQDVGDYLIVDNQKLRAMEDETDDLVGRYDDNVITIKFPNHDFTGELPSKQDYKRTTANIKTHQRMSLGDVMKEVNKNCLF